MERLKLRFEDAKKALKTFEEIMNEPYTVIVRDAAIQRFEYTFEALWKFLKEYLKQKEGVVAATPKEVFRQIGNLKLISPEDVVSCLEMTDRRNDTSHTYKEGMAKIIYDLLPKYVGLIQNILKRIDLK